jgi:putative spermidine/putrescine transport system permease protein
MRGTGFWPRFRRSMLLGLAWSVLGFLIVPMLVVLPVSLTDRSYLSLPEHGLSLRHYEAFFTNSIWIGSTVQSLIIATAATVASVVLGALCAIGCWRLSNGVSAVVRLLMLAPLIVPTVIQGLAMYRFWVFAGIFDTYIGVILAHTLTGIPYVVITVSASLATFDVKLEQAARSLGASALDTVRLVIMPSIAPGLLSGGVFAFVHSFDELVLVLFVTSREIRTLPKRIWDGLQDRIDPTIASVAVILIAITLVLLLLDILLRQRRLHARRRALADDMARSTAEFPAGAVG